MLVRALYTTALLLPLALLSPPSARAQPVPAPDAAAKGPEAPGWVTVPTPLPAAWRIQDTGGDSITFTDGETRLALVRQAGTPDELRDALVSQTAGELGGAKSSPYYLAAGARWVEARLVDGPGRSGPRALIAARPLKGGAVVTAVIRGGQRGRGVGEAVDLLERLRFAGEDDPAPHGPLDLEGRPDARINPVGLFVTLPKDWKPNLVKGEGSFWLRNKTARVRYAKPSASDLRELDDQKSVAAAHPEYTIQPLFWHPPGSYRAWQLLKREGDDVVEVRAIHLVRYKKLDDWSYHLVEVEGVDPHRGFAHVRSLLARLKMIP